LIWNVGVWGRSNLNPLLSFAQLITRIMNSNKVKATVLDCHNHKSGSLIICELENGQEVAVYYPQSNLELKSTKIELTPDGNYYRYRQVITLAERGQAYSGRFGQVPS